MVQRDISLHDVFEQYPLSILFSLLLAIILGLFMLTVKPEHVVARWIFAHLPFSVIHDTGLVVIVLTILSMAAGAAAMAWHLFKGFAFPDKPAAAFVAAVQKTVSELVSMKRFRTCDDDETSYWKTRPVIMRPWFVHLTIMWGFLGLLAATILNFIFKDPATTIWLPTRLLGTIAGIFLMYGSSLAIGYRLKKITMSYRDSRLPDWLFLWTLWLAGATGFWMEAAVTVNAATMINQIVFLIHTIVSMELVLLFAFSKFAHALYRPLALFAYYFRKK